MRTLSKPGVLFPLLASALGLGVLFADKIPGPSVQLTDLIPENPLVLMIRLFILGVISLPLLVALLRYDWKIRFIDVLVLCAGWAIACQFSLILLSDIWARDSEDNFLSVVFGGLLRGGLFASISWCAAALVAPGVRVRRFAASWLIGIPVAVACECALIEGLKHFFDEYWIAEAGATVQVLVEPFVAVFAGGLLVNRVVSPRPDAVVTWSDLRWLLQVAACIAAIVGTIAMGRLIWIRGDFYQVRAIRERASAEVRREDYTPAPEWIRLAAHIGDFEGVDSALARMDGMRTLPVSLAFAANEGHPKADALRHRAANYCSSSGNRKLDCLQQLHGDLVDAGEVVLAAQAASALEAQWSVEHAAAMAPNKKLSLSKATELLATAPSDKGREAATIWDRAFEELPSLDAEGRREFAELLDWIPARSAVPRFGALSQALHGAGTENYHFGELARLYVGLMKSGRCSEALELLGEVDESKWKHWEERLFTDDKKLTFPTSDECLSRWSDFVSRKLSADEYQRTQLLDAIIRQQARSSPDKALAMAKAKNFDPKKFAEPLALALSETHRFPEALDYAAQVDDTRQVDVTVRILATQIAIEPATPELLERIRKDGYGDKALLALAGAKLVSAGERKAGLAALDEAEADNFSSINRPRLAADAAVALAAAGRCRTARLRLESLADSNQPSSESIAVDGLRAVYDSCSGR